MPLGPSAVRIPSIYTTHPPPVRLRLCIDSRPLLLSAAGCLPSRGQHARLRPQPRGPVMAHGERWHFSVCVCVSVYLCVHVCMCVCVQSASAGRCAAMCPIDYKPPITTTTTPTPRDPEGLAWLCAVHAAATWHPIRQGDTRENGYTVCEPWFREGGGMCSCLCSCSCCSPVSGWFTDPTHVLVLRSMNI